MDDFVGKTMPAHGESNFVKCDVHTKIAGNYRVRIQRCGYSGQETREEKDFKDLARCILLL